jgi:hypothetical protein
MKSIPQPYVAEECLQQHEARERGQAMVFESKIG